MLECDWWHIVDEVAAGHFCLLPRNDKWPISLASRFGIGLFFCCCSWLSLRQAFNMDTAR